MERGSGAAGQGAEPVEEVRLFGAFLLDEVAASAEDVRAEEAGQGLGERLDSVGRPGERGVQGAAALGVSAPVAAGSVAAGGSAVASGAAALSATAAGLEVRPYPRTSTATAR
ncbi:hypothetical protein [Streptomyces camelliae]|uniref:hypothetical protein n=1 Tax=Streptomyces camelliae TaxID=3004093 RepID=UPI003D1732C7